ncbi:MAG: DUF1246 domain-containing protein, partial [Candidatus Brockarchaeota archaeon]|nr:DUF1246 domain-containing protein [Candidatus Brockarchaeota archaeon]
MTIILETASKHAIATIGSHSALQILKGGKDEGFRTIAVCKKDHSFIYRHFGVADRIIEIPSYSEFHTAEKDLLMENAILVPHASLIAYIGLEAVENIRIPYYGNRRILLWESDRNLQRRWLEKAGLNLPRVYEEPEEIDRLCIVKFQGAKGGQGYFLARSSEEFFEKIGGSKDYSIQEYVVGIPVYIHYFYSII